MPAAGCCSFTWDHSSKDLQRTIHDLFECPRFLHITRQCNEDRSDCKWYLVILSITSLLIQRFMLANSPADPIGLLALLDAPTEALSWVGVKSWPTWTRTILNGRDVEAEAMDSLQSIRTSFRPVISGTSSSTGDSPGGYTWADLGFSASDVTRGIGGACQSVLEAEPDMTRFDTIVGDGDCGHTFASGAKGEYLNSVPRHNSADVLNHSVLAAIIEALNRCELQPQSMSPASLVSRAGEILEGTMGGTIGACMSTQLRCECSPSTFFRSVCDILHRVVDCTARRPVKRCSFPTKTGSPRARKTHPRTSR